MCTSILLGILLIILVLSVWQRMQLFRKALEESKLKVSPLSLAIQELIAISGGIYLSLIMLVSFLKLNIPDIIMIYEVSMDPLACFAISLGILQPFALHLINIIKKHSLF